MECFFILFLFIVSIALNFDDVSIEITIDRAAGRQNVKQNKNKLLDEVINSFVIWRYFFLFSLFFV